MAEDRFPWPTDKSEVSRNYTPLCATTIAQSNLTTGQGQKINVLDLLLRGLFSDASFDYDSSQCLPTVRTQNSEDRQNEGTPLARLQNRSCILNGLLRLSLFLTESRHSRVIPAIVSLMLSIPIILRPLRIPEYRHFTSSKRQELSNREERSQR